MPHKDPVVRAEYMRAYKQRTKGQHRINRRMADRAKHANQRAGRYGAEGWLSTAEVRAVMAVGTCHYCGASERLGIDHVIPLCEGGLNLPENLVCCCHACNASKWRGDRPGKWSRKHDKCIACGTTDRRHFSGGRCAPCYSRERHRQEREARRAQRAVAA